MSKTKIAYVCDNCGEDYLKWQGQCSNCHEWNTIKEFKISTKVKNASTVAKEQSNLGYAGQTTSELKKISNISVKEVELIKTSSEEFNRVLGGGIVPGSAVLIGGNPGAGKSTILLQIVADLSKEHRVVYVTGEESLEQILLRIKKFNLNINEDNLYFLSETSVETIIELCAKVQPHIIIIDSIQVMHVEHANSSPGSVTQVRESSATLTRYAKINQVAVFMVGHVTKDGAIAGPKVLEHIIDCSIMLDSMSDARYRTLRTTKNRFGSVNEIGVFSMTEKGMREVKNPSAIFLSKSTENSPGSCVVVLWEGSRPLLVEIQALVLDTPPNNPISKRVSSGIDNNRIAILLAIISKHGKVNIYNKDIFVNVIGGIKVTETSVDIPLIISLISSMHNKVVPRHVFALGEVGLGGEVRPVNMAEERVKEAIKHGFTVAIIPDTNRLTSEPKGITIYRVKNIQELFKVLGKIFN